MSFNEESARKIINFLLEEDIDDFNRWIPEIEEFNSEQIRNLLEGDINYEYPIKNKSIFKKLVLKFDNFEKIIFKWYIKEENYKYLKQLWLQYICIEDIRENLKNEKNDEKLTAFLENKKVNYSQWPNEVKEEFKTCVKKTIGTQIHEKEIKKMLIEEHSIFDNQIFKTMKETVNSFKDYFKDINEQAQKIFEESYSSIIKNVIISLICLVSCKIKSKASDCIDRKLTKKSLINQIKENIPNLKDAKRIAKEIMNKNFGPELTNITWGVGSNFDGEDDVCGWTFLKNYSDNPIKINIDLSGKNNETLTIMETLSTIFKNKMVCGLVGFASLVNLGFSIIEYNQISKIIETIKGKKFEKKFNEIKRRFRQHLKELDLTGDCNYYLSKINYVKANIEEDRDMLIKLLVEIEADIKLLEQKKKDSFYGLISSAIFGTTSMLGVISTGGFTAGIYCISALCNLAGGIRDTKNISLCSTTIDELEKLKIQIEEEKKKMDKELEDLNLKIKQKELNFPSYYKECDDLIQKQNEKIKNYLLNKKYF